MAKLICRSKCLTLVYKTDLIKLNCLGRIIYPIGFHIKSAKISNVWKDTCYPLCFPDALYRGDT